MYISFNLYSLFWQSTSTKVTKLTVKTVHAREQYKIAQLHELDEKFNKLVNILHAADLYGLVFHLWKVFFVATTIHKSRLQLLTFLSMTVCLSISIYLSLYLSIYVSIYLSIYLSIYSQCMRIVILTNGRANSGSISARNLVRTLLLSKKLRKHTNG